MGSAVAYVGEDNRALRAVYTDAWMPATAPTSSAIACTPELMMLAAPDVVFLHGRPAHRGEEVDAAVIDGPQVARVEAGGEPPPDRAGAAARARHRRVAGVTG